MNGLHRDQPETQGGNGQRQKQQRRWEAPKRKDDLPKRSVLGWFPALSLQEEWLSWELGKPRLLWGAEIHARLLCQGRARNKGSCCQPCHCMQPWQEVGLLSNLDTGQVSNKHVLSMSCVWHSSTRSTPRRPPWSAKLPTTHADHQSTQCYSAAFQMRSGVSQQWPGSCTNSYEQVDPKRSSALPASYKETGKKSCNAMLQLSKKEHYFSISRVIH